jgi:regulator of protease activity HflC (stomatin/prohibitin superfamily)
MMVWLAIGAFFVSVAVFIKRPNPKKYMEGSVERIDSEVGRTVMTSISAVAFLITIVFSVASSVAVVPPGHVGVQVLLGSVQSNTLPEGLSFVNPFVSVSHMSGRTQAYTMSSGQGEDAIVVLSSDGLRMPMDISIIYRLDPTHASWILQNVGYQYEGILLRPAARTAVRQAAANFTAQEAYSTKRDVLADSMMRSLDRSIVNIFRQRGFDHKAIHIEQVLLRNVNLPDRVKNAIEQKLESEQEAQKMTFVLQKERQEAERKKIEATGIQEFQEIVKKGIDDRLLRWKGIEATEKLAGSNNSKVIVIGGANGLPLILNTAEQKQ